MLYPDPSFMWYGCDHGIAGRCSGTLGATSSSTYRARASDLRGELMVQARDVCGQFLGIGVCIVLICIDMHCIALICIDMHCIPCICPLYGMLYMSACRYTCIKKKHVQ